MKTSQQGFTLIELMVVVIIIGVLAAFAIPQFQNSAVKSQLSRVMGETGALRTQVDLCLLDKSQCAFSVAESNLLKTLAATTQTSNRYTTAQAGKRPEISINDDGTASIKATFGDTAAGLLENVSLTWQRTADSWQCRLELGANTSADKINELAPSGCKAGTAAANGS